MKEIKVDSLLEKYCKNMKYGCNWNARRRKVLPFIRITYTKDQMPDKVEFLERNKKRKNKEKSNVKYIKLDKPIIILDDPENPGKFKWYETTLSKTKKGGKTKNNKTKKY